MNDYKTIELVGIEKALASYRATTLKLIDSMEREDFESLENLINERQALIDDMNNMCYTQEEFKEICGKLEIMLLQQKLNKLMSEKRADLRNKIDSIATSKNANKSYNKSFSVDSIYFNKKI